MKTRGLRRLAVVPAALAVLVLQPLTPAYANDNCGDAYYADFEYDTGTVAWTSQACMNAELAGGVLRSYRGIGTVTFSSDTATLIDIVSCNVTVTVYEFGADNAVTSGTQVCGSTAQSNGSATVDAGPTPVAALPVCGLQRQYYAVVSVFVTMWNGDSYGSGGVRSFAVTC